MRRQRLGDAVAHGRDQLGALGVGIRRAAPVGKLRPAVGLERDLMPVPGALAHLHGGLEQRELVGPRREAAVAAIRVQLAHDRHQGVIGGLHREIIEFSRARPAAASDLEARSAQQQRVERYDRLLVPAAGSRERFDPPERLGVDTAPVDS